MPTETVAIVAAIIIAFTVFALALAWADFHTRMSGSSNAEK